MVLRASKPLWEENIKQLHIKHKKKWQKDKFCMEIGSFPVIYLDCVVPMSRMGSVGKEKKWRKEGRKEGRGREGKRERERRKKEKALVYYFLSTLLSEVQPHYFLAIP